MPCTLRPVLDPCANPGSHPAADTVADSIADTHPDPGPDPGPDAGTVAFSNACANGCSHSRADRVHPVVLANPSPIERNAVGHAVGCANLDADHCCANLRARTVLRK